MKSIVAAALAVALGAGGAHAGVVITQTEHSSGLGGERNTEQTVMIQGKKQKVVTSDREIITDLDRDVLYIVSPAKKEYLEFSLPPTGRIAEAMGRGMPALTYKKTGSRHKVLGYECEDYTATGTVHGRHVTVTRCVSTHAPGAKESAEFEKAQEKVLKGTPMVATGEIPHGITLQSDSVMKTGEFKPPAGLPADQAAKLKQMFSNRKVENKVVASKVEVKKLAADTFTIPASYTREELPAPPAHPGAPGAAKPPKAK
jgi:Domain of unknown function (DUF4412)